MGIPCEQLVSQLCDRKQAYTQFGGKRPFGVSLLHGGWDPHYGFQLYQSDPSGNYGGWKATCVGNNWNAAVSMLKQEYKEGETSLDDALDLSIKVLSKTLDMTKLSPDKIELSTLTRENGKTKIQILPADKVDALIKKYEDAEAEAEEKKKKEAKKQTKENEFSICFIKTGFGPIKAGIVHEFPHPCIIHSSPLFRL